MPRSSLRFGCGLALVIALSAPQVAHADSGDESWMLRPSVVPQSLLGIRGTSFAASGEPDSLGLGVSSQSSAYLTLAIFTARMTSDAAIGGSRHGTEGLWASDLSLGLLLPLGEGHGPFLRIGARGYMFGNETTWLSNIEAPAGYAGYQVLRGPWLVEVAGRTGLVLDGRQTHYGQLNGFEVLETRHLGGSAEWGGHVALGYSILRLEGEYMHVDVSDRLGSPLDTWSASACFRPTRIGLCADYRGWVADIRRTDGNVSPYVVSYGGLSVGVWTP